MKICIQIGGREPPQKIKPKENDQERDSEI
jgi:hypothetical protein